MALILNIDNAIIVYRCTPFGGRPPSVSNEMPAVSLVHPVPHIFTFNMPRIDHALRISWVGKH